VTAVGLSCRSANIFAGVLATHVILLASAELRSDDHLYGDLLLYVASRVSLKQRIAADSPNQPLDIESTIHF